MLGNVIRRAVPPKTVHNMVAKRTIYAHMSGAVLSGLPRVKIPFAEKVATGIFMVTGFLATPAWVLTHMDDYRTLS